MYAKEVNLQWQVWRRNKTRCASQERSWLPQWLCTARFTWSKYCQLWCDLWWERPAGRQSNLARTYWHLCSVVNEPRCVTLGHCRVAWQILEKCLSITVLYCVFPKALCSKVIIPKLLHPKVGTKFHNTKKHQTKQFKLDNFLQYRQAIILLRCQVRKVHKIEDSQWNLKFSEYQNVELE